ncbi:hypothetical protein FOA52_006289 [Chlamydomonas sp. UWO 241]|nr:hypothetical protein FOA52_006289 [Chlamydomonas sp. UWO 241]
MIFSLSSSVAPTKTVAVRVAPRPCARAIAYRVICRAQEQPQETKNVVFNSTGKTGDVADTLASPSRRLALWGVSLCLALGVMGGSPVEAGEIRQEAGKVADKVSNQAGKVAGQVSDKASDIDNVIKNKAADIKNKVKAAAPKAVAVRVVATPRLCARAISHRVMCRAQEQPQEANIIGKTGNAADTLASHSRRLVLWGVSGLAFGGMAKVDASEEPDEYPTKSGIVSPNVENKLKSMTEGTGGARKSAATDPAAFDLPFDLASTNDVGEAVDNAGKVVDKITAKSKEGIDKVKAAAPK